MLIRLLKFEQLTFVNTTEETEALAEYFGFGNKWKKKTQDCLTQSLKYLQIYFVLELPINVCCACPFPPERGEHECG